MCVGGRGSERRSLSDTCAVTKLTSEYARVSGGVGGDFVPARPSSCTLTSIYQRRAREAYSERQVLKGTHSGAEGSGRVVVGVMVCLCLCVSVRMCVCVCAEKGWWVG